MRSFLVGLLLLALTSASFGQVRGEVESIGFGDGWYRPQCWTPMVVRLQSQISEPAEYRIEVHQHDLDFDHVIYVKDGITLNGQATQRWELCFLPEPIHGGLPEMSARDLQDRLRVYLTNKEGTRQLLQLPITSGVQSLEAQASLMGGFGMSKAYKLVLVVNDGSSRPRLAPESYDKAVGLVERPLPITVRPSALPQSALAYQAVDAVVWLSGDAHALSEEGSKQLPALQDWVRQGGTLIVCQPSIDAERAHIEPFADMLPIQWKVEGEWKVSVHEKKDLQPLIRLAAPHMADSWGDNFWKLKGPFSFARAVAKPGAIVETNDWIEWGDKPGSDRSPYIARCPYGLGCVTWVAQNLGDQSITGANTYGWQYVWDHVFGWTTEDRLPNDRDQKDEGDYAGDNYADLGSTLNKGVEFGAKGTGLIALAIIFFLIYWIVAGPGSYLFLAGKKHKEMSWAAFGAAALAATLITVLVVRLVLRGSPEIHHATDVRMVLGSQEPQPAIAISKIGLYIPRDGTQTLSLADTSGQFVSRISPLAIVPSNIENDYPANLDYQIPIPDAASSGGVSVDVPFRSTLKKLQATWAGDSSKTIRGHNVQLMLETGPPNFLKGTLDNLTGVDLKNVYIAFHDPSGQGGEGEDWVIFVPGWPGSGPQVHQDLGSLFSARQLPLRGGQADGTLTANPATDTTCWGSIRQQWQFYWFKNRSIEPGGMGQGSRAVDDLTDPIPSSFPMLSLFDRLPPVKRDKNLSLDPYTLLRRGARNLNMSPAMEAGEMVVLAQADNQPLPYTFDVNGNKVGGTGTVFYQFALPLERVAPPPPPPVPTTKP